MVGKWQRKAFSESVFHYFIISVPQQIVCVCVSVCHVLLPQGLYILWLRPHCQNIPSRFIWLSVSENNRLFSVLTTRLPSERPRRSPHKWAALFIRFFPSEKWKKLHKRNKPKGFICCDDWSFVYLDQCVWKVISFSARSPPLGWFMPNVLWPGWSRGGGSVAAFIFSNMWPPAYTCCPRWETMATRAAPFNENP